MDADELRETIDNIRDWKTTPDNRLREAFVALERAHNSLDVLEGRVQDLQEHILESQPSPWEAGVLRALKMDAYELGDSMNVAKDHAAQKYGYTSPEYATIEALASALDPYGKD